MHALVIQRQSEESRPMVHEEPRMLMVTLLTSVSQGNSNRDTEVLQPPLPT
jgi:hypothetical protein